uniref:Uncharacterized protein n=1 Tax=Minutocellus polymorphus TaxID=265543 RepID=A0A7S0AKI9_9STRA
MTTPPALRPYRIAGRHFVPLIVLSLFGQLTFASATAHSFCFAHNSPKQSQRADENVDAITSSNIHVGRRKAVETAGAAFISSQVPIAVIAADEQGVVKDNGDPLAAFGASLSGSDASAIMSGATSSQQLAGAGATTLPSSAAAGGPPRTAAAGTPPSSLDATLDQLSKKRTIEPRTHG